MAATITLPDRLAIQDRLLRYAWCMDTGDDAGVAACFTPEGVLTDARGVRFEGRSGVRRFAAAAMTGPLFRGRQHHIQPLLLQADEDGYRVASYYQVVRFPKGGVPGILSLGWYEDRVRRSPEGSWLIAAKRLRHWDAATAPAAGALGSAPFVRIAASPSEAADRAASDRIQLLDLMHDYAAALDTGDLPRMQAAFVPGATLDTGGVGVVKAPDGVRTFLSNVVAQPGFAGRQHRIFPLSFAPIETGWRAVSYWKVARWTVGEGPALVSLGWYEDDFGRTDDGWRFTRKVIRRWDSQSAPTLKTAPRADLG